jgi:glycosyltransferase involved in cell wall biosynthesis
VRATGAPSFSVVVAAYNAADVIHEAVASALGQTARPLEVIVCDDGSTDDLGAALAPFGERAVLLRQDNRGAAAAHNRSLAAASGGFVAVLDADDAWEPTRLERLGELAAQQPELDVLASDAWFESEGRRTGRFHAANPFPVADQRTVILQRCFVWNPAVRRERLLAVNGWDPAFRIAYDWDCWMRVILDGAVAGLVDEPLAVYRLHSASLSANRVASLRERVALMDKAASHPGLSAAERGVVARSRVAHRARLVAAGRR